MCLSVPVGLYRFHSNYFKKWRVWEEVGGEKGVREGERDRGLAYPPPVQPGGHTVSTVRGAVVSGVVLEPHQSPIPVKGRGIEKQLSGVKRKQERPERKTAKL